MLPKWAGRRAGGGGGLVAACPPARRLAREAAGMEMEGGRVGHALGAPPPPCGRHDGSPPQGWEAAVAAWEQRTANSENGEGRLRPFASN